MRTIIIFILIVLCTSLQQSALAQGCVAIRSTGNTCSLDHPGSGASTSGSWLLNANNRYFKSFRHFVGTEEQKQRLAQKTEVINHAYALDLSLMRILNSRWSVALDVPIIYNSRSSLYEHGGKTRNYTHSFGLGDIRFTAYAWVLDPAKSPKGNIQVGVGIKLPTGDYKYQDYFHNDTGRVLGPVDQSIQLGDGGTGFTAQVNAYRSFSRTISVYGNIYYLFNPREQNGVSTARGGKPSTTSMLYGSDVMSVADQYLVRAGANITLKKLTLSAGIRHECLPARDLIGGSEGFRRPGYIISAEPGLQYKFKKLTAYAFVPVALQRSRIQSVPDKNRTRITGVFAQGDAAFADYAVNAGISVHF